MSTVKTLGQLKKRFQGGKGYAYDTKTGDFFTESFEVQAHLLGRWQKEFPEYILTDPNMERLPSYTIQITHPKVISLCPYRGFPDVTKLEIKIVPDRRIIELSSLAKFFELFTTIGITHELLAVTIQRFITQAIAPLSCTVVATFEGFAGMDVKITASGEIV